MDWELAINRNRDALLRLVAVLFSMAGLPRDGSVETLPRYVRSAILLVLRPAEFALRRLVMIVARELPEVEASTRPAPTGKIRRGKGSGRVPSFPLYDPRVRFGTDRPRYVPGPGPRIFCFDASDPVIEEPTVPSPDDPVNAVRLCLRLRSILRALETLPKQARRLVRMRARRKPLSPMRPGSPCRKRRVHEVDDILSDCHSLARYAMRPPDI